MSEPLPHDIKISDGDDRVAIEIPGGRWEGTAAEAERVLTGLHYAVGRARPGTNIGSMFVNGGLWGGKFFETDRREAVREMRALIAGLERRLASMEAEADGAEDRPSDASRAGRPSDG